MEITLTPDMERYLQDKVRAGQYASPSEVINDALLVLQVQEQLSPEDISELRDAIQIGIDQHLRGESTPLDMTAIEAEVRRQAGR